MNLRIVAVLAAGLLAGSMAADAGTVYKHPFPIDRTLVDAYCSSCFGTYRLWDVFDLAHDTDITGVEARLFALEGTTEDLDLSIWTADRTSQLYSQTFAFGSLPQTRLDILTVDVSAPVAGLTLPAGSYSVSIYDGRPDAYLAWWQARTTVHGRSFQSDLGDGNGLDLAFRILGNSKLVPEPGTLALLGLGLAGLGLSRRRRAA